MTETLDSLWISDFPESFLIGIIVVLGLLFGSFLNVVIYRLPLGISVVTPPSACPACKEQIKPWQNIPVLGWLALRGKAACCGVKIPVRYPAVELLGGLSAVWSAYFALSQLDPFDPLLDYFLWALSGLALCLIMISLTFIDLEHMILPDSLTLGGLVLGLLLAPLHGLEWWESILGAIAGALLVWFPFIWLYEKLRGFAGMGLGDAKLLALAGAWFGPIWILPVLVMGAVQGTIAAILIFVFRGKIDEPESVKKERQEILAELEKLEGEERAIMEAELAKDPLFAEAGEGLGAARLPFGPLLCLAILQVYFFRAQLIEFAEMALLIPPSD